VAGTDPDPRAQDGGVVFSFQFSVFGVPCSMPSQV
jgi:hypothetical protein